MACLPQSGGCERPATDAFVDHFNRISDARYAHEACLDVLDSTSPQPEALYLDRDKNGRLVVERKSISWPSDYTYRHSNDHFVSTIFSEALRGLPFDGLYQLRLPMFIQGTQQELRPLAQKAAEYIRAHWSQVTEKTYLLERLNQNWWWTFSLVSPWDRGDDAPVKGLMVRFEGRPVAILTDYLDPEDLPEKLVAALQKIYASCVKKFATYQDARRILVLDPHGDLRHKDAKWWQEVFAELRPPDDIQEIWSGIFDWVDEDSQGWIFERLY